MIQVEAHLLDTAGKGGSVLYVLPVTSILGRLPVVLRFWLEIWGPSCLVIAVVVATVPITTIMTSPELIQAEGMKTAAQCARLHEFLSTGLVQRRA